MGRRQRLISTSILRAIFHYKPADKRAGLLARILAFFSFLYIALSRYRAETFRKLRNEIWGIDEDDYTESFRSPSKGKRTDLISIGDLGYSGSTFFTTPNSKYLLKSLPRHFEQSFFRNRLFDPYVEHMEHNPTSLLVRITDLLFAPMPALGSFLGFVPSHHIVMENTLYGKSSCSRENQQKWETYDLKPNDYFYPERDILDGALAPERVKERLTDDFPDKVRVSHAEKEELVEQLLKDTKLLQDANAVDYSLLLVRYPASLSASSSDGSSTIPVPPGKVSPWRAGVLSRDRKWVYRFVLLDFFWAKDALQAQTLTGLVKFYNFFKIGRDHGPMSITTTSDEYRSRFLKMVDAIVEVPDSAGRPSGEVRSPVPKPLVDV